MSWIFEKYPFSCVLDFRPSFFLGWFLYRLFGRVQIDDRSRNELREKQREGTILYVTKYPGHLDFLLYHYRLRKSRLPYPRIGLDLNMALFFPVSQSMKMVKFYIRFMFKHNRKPNPYQNGLLEEALQKGVPTLLGLLDPRRFKRQFVGETKDPITHLLEIQEKQERPIYLVPSLVLYKQAPERDPKGLLTTIFGYRDNPGPVRKIFLFFRHNRRAFIDLGSPINLKTVLDRAKANGVSHTEVVSRIRERIIEEIDTQKRAIIGPVIRSRQELKEKVLNDEEVLQTIERLSKSKPDRHRQLKAKASEYFDEIAADYSPTYVVLTYSILKRFWKRVFQGIEIDPAEFAEVRNWARRGPVIFVPSHKSHIDYLILNYLLYEHYVQVPRIAAGQNLAFWPAGHIFRKCGAFFIRRSFAGAKLYTKVFSAYVGQLLAEGYFIEFFIEGGRSRSGKLVLPKTGFLSILLDAYLKKRCEDLIFVPASIVYDKVMEEKSYLREQQGAPKERESFRQVLKARELLKKKYGKIYIRFGTPLSLRKYLEQQHQKPEETEQSLALKLVRAINAVTPVTPLALTSSAILSRHKKSFDTATLAQGVEVLRSFLEERQAPMASSLENPSGAMEETLKLLETWKIVTVLEELSGKSLTYAINSKKRREVAYYKNSIIHFFVDYSLIAVSLLSGQEAEKSISQITEDYLFLSDLLKNEFIFGQPEKERDNALSYFVNKGFVRPGREADRFVVTKKGYHDLPLWAGLIREFLEAYWIAAKAAAASAGQKKNRAELLKKMVSLGNKLVESGVVEAEEAVSHITFQNAFVYLNEKVLRSPREKEVTDEEVRNRAESLADRIYSLSHYTSSIE